ncbi:hypothetical protein HW555_010810 [Spodoptera exigua]|uniref:Major facilitator superfamily (MFS) profile domain-containing protein n=1 Tax=Spodoptera exigua TaxID=7107 RepID=A0A835G6L3_SPOEX|nr:hypothetical protein HW555_010810 [Spodoptera exigua]
MNTCAFIGGIMGGFAMRLGRRTVLIATALPYTLAWLATALSNSVHMISAASFCGGMLICCINMTTQITAKEDFEDATGHSMGGGKGRQSCPSSTTTLLSTAVYVTEIAVPEIRGCLSSVLKILSQIGILISFSIGAYLNWYQLALMVAAAPILLFFALFFIPETPSSLLLRGKEQEAEESLQWLRGPEADIRQELATIRTNILASKLFNDDNAGKFKALLSKRMTRPVLITCGLMFFQRFTGANLFNFYAVKMFKKTFRTMNPHGGAIATSVAQLLASCLSGMLIDNVGRLPLLMISGVMMSIALAGFGSYAYYEEVFRNSTDLMQSEPTYDWIPLLCVLTFTIAFSLGISPISSLLIGELFPLEYRSTGSAMATSFSHLCGFVNVKTATDIQDYIGLYGLFWMYAGISVLCLLFVVLFVPETKGREIDEMDPKYVESLCINR